MRAAVVPEFDILGRISKIGSRFKNRSLNSFVSLLGEEQDLEEYARVRNGAPLGGGAIALKDNIVTSSLPTTCASRMLQSFSSPYEATVVKLINSHGGVIIGKTNLDEFGMGSHSINSCYGPVKGKMSPHNRVYAAGGSSGGSAVATGNHTAYVSLGTDTGGSVRLPAAYSSIVGFKPSYGLISRWGIVSYANSLDTVGILSRDPWAAKKVFDILNRHDPKDPTSLSQLSRARLDDRKTKRIENLSTLKIGVPKEYNIEELSPSVRRYWKRTIKLLIALGHSVRVISLPSTPQALSAYYVLAPAEASSNLAKYDGVRYGSRSSATLSHETMPEVDHTDSRKTSEADSEIQEERREWEPQTHQEKRASASENHEPSAAEDQPLRSALFSRTRGTGFGEEVKRRILLGSYSLSAEAIDNYFVQAQKVRRLVQMDFDKVFALPNITSIGNSSTGNDDGVDIILCPTAPTEPPYLEDLEHISPLDAYTNDVFTVPASLAGIPAISVPVSRWLAPNKNVVPIGMQFIAQYGDDQIALALADQLHRYLVTKPVSSEFFRRKESETYWADVLKGERRVLHRRKKKWKPQSQG